MENKNLSSRLAIGILMVLFAFTLMGCYEGYVVTDVAAEKLLLLSYLPPASLRDLTENPRDDIWIIDVRPAAAYNAGHIPTALSFPSSEIGDRLDELPLDQYLVIQCETGIRAQAVIQGILEPAGYTRVMNWGGILRWTFGLVTD